MMVLVTVDAANAFRELARLVDPSRTFSLREVARLAGLDYATAYTWLRRGLIHPAGAVRHGKRTPFDFMALYVVGLLAGLRRRGVPMATVERVAHFLYGPAPKSDRRAEPAAEGEAVCN
jgi:DNA-binding transcriptional MerR regulator